MNTTTPTVHSYYRYNIEPRLLDAQARVFDHLGVPLVQDRNDRLDHAGWMNDLLTRDDLDDVVVVADIDAYPLKFDAYASLVAAAERGAVAGLAQTTNHKDPTKIYAAPMFIAFRKDLYRAFGSPDHGRYATGDVAQIMTDIAQARGVEVALTYPSFAVRPMWPLADYGIYGIGTFYGNHDFFHLYQARLSEAVELFCAVSAGVVAGRHDWARYLEIMSLAPIQKRRGLLSKTVHKAKMRLRSR